MRLTPTLRTFVVDMAARFATFFVSTMETDNDQDYNEAFMTAWDDYSTQIAEDDAAHVVRYALDEGVSIPRALKKFIPEAENLW